MHGSETPLCFLNFCSLGMVRNRQKNGEGINLKPQCESVLSKSVRAYPHPPEHSSLRHSRTSSFGEMPPLPQFPTPPPTSPHSPQPLVPLPGALALVGGRLEGAVGEEEEVVARLQPLPQRRLHEPEVQLPERGHAPPLEQSIASVQRWVGIIVAKWYTPPPGGTVAVDQGGAGLDLRYKWMSTTANLKSTASRPVCTMAGHVAGCAAPMGPLPRTGVWARDGGGRRAGRRRPSPRPPPRGRSSPQTPAPAARPEGGNWVQQLGRISYMDVPPLWTMHAPWEAMRGMGGLRVQRLEPLVYLPPPQIPFSPPLDKWPLFLVDISWSPFFIKMHKGSRCTPPPIEAVWPNLVCP